MVFTGTKDTIPARPLLAYTICHTPSKANPATGVIPAKAGIQVVLTAWKPVAQRSRNDAWQIRDSDKGAHKERPYGRFTSGRGNPFHCGICLEVEILVYSG